MKISIFFGGQSREREVSFAGGRTVYDNLNKGLFEPVPIFVDSLGNFIYLDWSYIYKGTIRDFYPPVKHLPSTENGFQVYVESLGKLSEENLAAMIKEVGRQVFPHQFAQLFDFAFLALHGPYGEDGNIQGLLEWHGIPYSGSGILPSAIGIDKALQRDLLRNFGFPSPKSNTTNRARWQKADKSLLFSQLQEELGLPLVVKAAHQGSSIGVNILYEADEKAFIGAVEKALFIEEIKGEDWQKYSQQEKVKLLMELVDIRQGIGMPLVIYLPEGNKTIYHPEELLKELDAFFVEKPSESLSMSAVDGEDTVVFESFIAGKEFSCIVVQDADGQPIALPPTEIVKRNSDMFDYRSKYLPGMTRKVTPIAIDSEKIRHIQAECCRMFELLHFNVYARIDGFITESGEVFLNDPNTTSGMMPSSFFFHQAAEIGLNPSQFLTYLIRTSLAERIKSGKKSHHLAAMLSNLDERIASQQAQQADKIKVAVILGGYSSERHISVESGRNIYEKLASSEKYEPIPVFLTGNESQHEMYVIPTNILLKDNADDIKEKARQSLSGEKHEVIAEVIERASSITGKYAKNAIFKAIPIDYEALAHQVDAVFIALHGRPGEDGAVQEQLDKVGLPYNGSNVESSRITIDKYVTNELLKENGISVAKHTLLHKKDWLADQAKAIQQVEQEFGFPIIAKPADDGCSSAVKKINNAEELKAFAELMFREQEDLLPAPAQKLKLSINEEFPQKSYILIEELIDRAGADHFLEVTGGMLTKMTAQGPEYEVFEPSEALASGEILSLEEKFLAGEGQNITPARFAKDSVLRDKIAEQVRDTLGKAARVLGIEGYTRIDAFVRIYGDKAETIIIEANSLPGMTPATCIFHQSAINGYTPLAFIDQILSYGMARQQGNLMQS